MAAFRWTERATKAALALAEGKTKAAVIRETAIPERTLYNWLGNLEFSAEVDRLTLMTDVASRAGRVRIAKRAVANRVDDSFLFSKADLLDWLKYLQSETDGIKLDLAALFENVTSLAGSGQDGPDTETGSQEQGKEKL